MMVYLSCRRKIHWVKERRTKEVLLRAFDGIQLNEETIGVITQVIDNTTYISEADIPTDISGVPIDLTNYYEETFVILHLLLMVFDEIRSDLENCFNQLTFNIQGLFGVVISQNVVSNNQDILSLQSYFRHVY
ncbi:Hypothetical_protein [Hexamita inflata]|uniref:Hypothetical_protein n=1 Tax=Hexamita inflata TaxID=28002 RepID=A0AA86PL26_9EUKA|nr:Hypothetical protein HINF_LOCUS28926 [Hexamita inflata]